MILILNASSEASPMRMRWFIILHIPSYTKLKKLLVALLLKSEETLLIEPLMTKAVGLLS